MKGNEEGKCKRFKKGKPIVKAVIDGRFIISNGRVVLEVFQVARCCWEKVIMS